MSMNMVNMIVLIVFLVLAYYDVKNSETGGKRTFKPALMPLLALYYATGVLAGGAGAAAVSVPVILALLCGCAGDTLLLGGEKMFTFGLLAFLAGHILYAAAYLRDIAGTMIPVWYWAGIACYAAYAVIVMRRLLPSVDRTMKIPVIAYMSVLLLMSWLALLRFGALGGRAVLTWIGSVLFAVSDTILAFQVFRGRSGKGIMETYVIGQLLIVEGMLL